MRREWARQLVYFRAAVLLGVVAGCATARGSIKSSTNLKNAAPVTRLLIFEDVANSLFTGDLYHGFVERVKSGLTSCGVTAGIEQVRGPVDDLNQLVAGPIESYHASSVMLIEADGGEEMHNRAVRARAMRSSDRVIASHMAQKLGFWTGAFSWGGTEWADRKTINENAAELEIVEDSVTSLRAVLQRQTQELLYMRAMFSGLIETLHTKQPFAEGELEAAVQRAWTELTAPPPTPLQTTAGHPYRGEPVAAKAPERTVTCTKCLRKVPASQTTITAEGEVCDSCS